MLSRVAAIPLIAVSLLTAAVSSNTSCPKELELLGSCNTGSEIIVGGEQTEPGTPGTSPIGNEDPGPGTGGPWYPPAEFEFGDCLTSWDDYIGCFRATEDEDEAADEDQAPAIPAITIADLARFAPSGSLLTAEPENVGIAGLPTNFVATASVHTASGTLFGYPVAVRFTPAGYDFTFGDGTSASSSTGGRSWESLGQAQFTPTETSHTYARRGTYLARVDVRYTAEVDLGIGWFPVAGEVTAAGATQEIRIFEAHTALVAYTCEQSPSSPGC